jgi:hypothetical protein
MSQVFTEIPLPQRDKELVVSARWIPAANDTSTGFCSQMQGNGLCNMFADWQCHICGQWTCNLHEHKDVFQGYTICENCGKLSKFDQEQIHKFREEMNAL